MLNLRKMYWAGAAGAGAACLLLIGMALIQMPAGLTYPGAEVLTGHLRLGAAETEEYMSAIRLLFGLDSLFLVGWILAWAGLAAHLRERQPFLAWLSLGLGLAGAVLDFTENGLVWGAVQAWGWGMAADGAWLAGWKAVQSLSYVLPFAGAAAAAAALWGEKGWAQAAAWTGSALLLPAAAGIYFPALVLAANVWFLIWFLCVGMLLRRCASSV